MAGRIVDKTEQELMKKAKGGWFGFGADPEAQFQLALYKWKSISEAVLVEVPLDDKEYQAYLNVQPHVEEILSWLLKAAEKNHHEAIRCYALLAFDYLQFQFYLNHKRLPATPSELQELFFNNQKVVQTLKNLIDKPIFQNDELIQTILFPCFLAGTISDIQRCFEMIVQARTGLFQLLLAYMIVKAKTFNYSIPLIKQALKEAVNFERVEGFKFEETYLYLLQFREILDKLKSYTLDDAKKLLESIKLPFNPLECSLYSTDNRPEWLVVK